MYAGIVNFHNDSKKDGMTKIGDKGRVPQLVEEWQTRKNEWILTRILNAKNRHIWLQLKYLLQYETTITIANFQAKILWRCGHTLDMGGIETTQENSQSKITVEVDSRFCFRLQEVSLYRPSKRTELQIYRYCRNLATWVQRRSLKDSNYIKPKVCQSVMRF